MAIGRKPPRFDGSDYVPSRDDPRLNNQLGRIFGCMKDGRWRTLPEISSATGDPPASISAQLRHLRKARFGSHTVNKQHRGSPAAGLYEYQLIVTVIPPSPPSPSEQVPLL